MYIEKSRRLEPKRQDNPGDETKDETVTETTSATMQTKQDVKRKTKQELSPAYIESRITNLANLKDYTDQVSFNLSRTKKIVGYAGYREILLEVIMN